MVSEYPADFNTALGHALIQENHYNGYSNNDSYYSQQDETGEA